MTATLRYRIRAIVDAAERWLCQPEIFAKVLKERGVSRDTFSVTVAQMLRDRQLSRRRATKALRKLYPRVHSVYGPGRMAVEERAFQRAPQKLVGFMEMKRQREARARARRAVV